MMVMSGGQCKVGWLDRYLYPMGAGDVGFHVDIIAACTGSTATTNSNEYEWTAIDALFRDQHEPAKPHGLSRASPVNCAERMTGWHQDQRPPWFRGVVISPPFLLGRSSPPPLPAACRRLPGSAGRRWRADHQSCAPRRSAGSPSQTRSSLLCRLGQWVRPPVRSDGWWYLDSSCKAWGGGVV